MTFKEKLVRLRKIKGLTQDEFASAVGVSRQAVYKWESGQSYPEVAKLLEIKILFNISIDDLLDENYIVELPEKKKKRRAAKVEKAEVSDPSPAESAEEVPVAAVEEKAEEIAPAPVEEAPAPKEEPVQVAEEPAADDSAKKKVGFFGRIFGRR